MNQILDAKGNPVKQEQEQKDKPAQKTIPIPVEGELILGAFVDEIVEDGEEGNIKRTVKIRFQAHAAVSPMELLSVLNDFATTLQPAAQKQMANTIQKAPAGTLEQLKNMGVPIPGK